MSRFSNLGNKLYSILSDPLTRRLCKELPRHPDLLWIPVTFASNVIRRSIYCLVRWRAVSPAIKELLRFQGRMDLIPLVRKLEKISVISDSFCSLPSLSVEKKPTYNPLPFQPEIRLASRKIPFHPSLFVERFADDEDHMALHRFVWLLCLFSEYPDADCARFGANQILAWCEKFPEPDEDLKFGSYTVCERLVSWLQFIMLTSDYGVVDEKLLRVISESYSRQLRWLGGRLEFHGRYTNNHVLNNARALYFCGALLNLPDAANLGREIFLSETDVMIVDGVLQEGSSHYQMLLTRSYLEVYLAAVHSDDVTFSEWLEKRLLKMLSVCNLMQSRFVADEYPLFGDISPDVDPDWFVGYPFSLANKCNESQWLHLFRKSFTRIKKIMDVDLSAIQAVSGGDFSWHCLRAGDYEVWIMLKNRLGCHGHHDNGSVVIFCGGKPVIIDPGLATYSIDSSKFIHQAGVSAHSIPLLNGFAPEPDRNSFWAVGLFSSKANIIEATENCLEFIVGYFPGNGELKRKITVASDGVTVSDSLQSFSKPINYCVSWNIAGNIKDTTCVDNNICYDLDDGTYVRINGNSSLTSRQGVAGISKRYGVTDDRSVIMVDSMLKPDENVAIYFTKGHMK